VSGETDLDGFLAKFTPLIEAQARVALSWMRARLPGACQLVYDNYNALGIGFGTSDKRAGLVLSIVVYPRWVSLFFARGAELPDPHGLLKGTGSTFRHIVLGDSGLLDSQEVGALIDAALAIATPPLDRQAKGSLAIRAVAAKQRPRRPA